jgi:hypothetical protein
MPGIRDEIVHLLFTTVLVVRLNTRCYLLFGSDCPLAVQPTSEL